MVAGICEESNPKTGHLAIMPKVKALGVGSTLLYGVPVIGKEFSLLTPRGRVLARQSPKPVLYPLSEAPRMILVVPAKHTVEREGGQQVGQSTCVDRVQVGRRLGQFKKKTWSKHLPRSSQQAQQEERTHQSRLPAAP
jgi:hypothetical protein